ncbi:MAG: hypothetical protein IJF49_02110 [Clostridia bacterium]|nr:hypothetical protein [Clostridia bacterium]
MKSIRFRINRMMLLLTMLILLTAVLVLPIAADFGPKPSLSVTVINPPDETYYMDLLIPTDPTQEYFSNLSEEELAACPPEVLACLRDYNDENWRTALTYGTRIPLFGDLVGRTLTNGNVVHHFSYYATPTEYRLIFVTAEGDTYVSPTIERHSFRQTLTYDFSAQEIVSQTSIPRAYLIQFTMTCLCTLVLEGILLWVFGFLRKEHRGYNLGVFALLNLLTQIVLTAVSGSALIFEGAYAAYFALVLSEIGIFAFEAVALARLLRGYTRGRRVGYALTANLVSAVVSWLLITFASNVIY